MMCPILGSEGIPAMKQRSIDNPEFGPSGPRNVLVKASDVERARAALGLEPAQQTQAKGRHNDGKPNESVEIHAQQRSIWERLLHRPENTTPPTG